MEFNSHAQAAAHVKEQGLGRGLVSLTLASASGDKAVMGSLLIELYSDVCPKTCEQFLKGVRGTLPNGYSYKGSPIHRIVRHAYVQGGDVVDGTGQGNPGFTLPDETYALNHDAEGCVGLASNGEPHSGATQFYVALRPLPWLDGKRVVFGKVLDAAGLALLRKLEALPLNNERPCPDVVISAAEVLVA